MTDLKLIKFVPWVGHPSASPVLTREANGTLSVAANGTRTCMGGWQAHYTNVTPGQSYHVQWDVDYEDLDHPFDALRCRALWTEVTPEQASNYETAGQWGSNRNTFCPNKPDPIRCVSSRQFKPLQMVKLSRSVAYSAGPPQGVRCGSFLRCTLWKIR